MAAKRKKVTATKQSRTRDSATPVEPITQEEVAFCHYLMGRDEKGRKRTTEVCAKLAGLPLDEVESIRKSARVRNYCDAYTHALLMEMARSEAQQRADYELSPTAVAMQLMMLSRTPVTVTNGNISGQVMAAAKLLDWFGDMDSEFKSRSQSDLKYFADHGIWPEQTRRLAPPKDPSNDVVKVEVPDIEVGEVIHSEVEWEF